MKDYRYNKKICGTIIFSNNYGQVGSLLLRVVVWIDSV